MNTCLSLIDFQKMTPRKMTIHALSNNIKDCVSFIECLAREKMNERELYEKNIKKKKNIFSFMNYKIYDSPELMVKNIKSKSKKIQEDPKKLNFYYSEVIIVLDNEKINDHIDNLKNGIIEDEDDILSENYFTPFIIFLTPRDLDLSDFSHSKTFQYKFILKDILNFKLNERDNNYFFEICAFFRKLYILFSYYNELGDTFSFVNSEGKKCLVKIEDDTNITVFINILLLGRSGSGKSTLLNCILDEKKSIEGGIGISTTTKNILIYQKENIPLRFYDVRGIENESTVKNYITILSNFYGERVSVKESINAIFYCMEYKNGTIVEQMENKIFAKLIEFRIPILFIITKCPFNPYKKTGKKKTDIDREKKCNKIKNVVLSIIRDIFRYQNKENLSEEFIQKFIRFYFINLIRDDSLDIQPFGLDKVLSFFPNAVSNEDWEILKQNCLDKNEVNCRNFCLKNLYLNPYSDFETLNMRNKIVALEYINSSSAFFSLDEDLFIDKFINLLQRLYGFDFKRAKQIVGEEIEEKSLSEKILKGFLRFTVTSVSVSGPALVPVLLINIIIKGAAMTGSWLLLKKDCEKIIDIFYKAFTPFKFETLLSYIESFKIAIEYLQTIGKKIIEES